jgi:hypothetical protein
VRQREQDLLIGLAIWGFACIAIYGLCGLCVVLLIAGEFDEIDP